MKRNTKACLSYLVLWISGLFFFLFEEDKFVKFHAMQSMIVFGILNVLSWIPFLGWVFGIVGLVIWIVCMVKAGTGVYYKLPIIGDWAERIVR